MYMYVHGHKESVGKDVSMLFVQKQINDNCVGTVYVHDVADLINPSNTL